jgi:uncharacterized LabA/DUF88 family protein
VSKNVAVFVDVANIFYAAKAAGVDIDYVTLLKSATAGRDFVRAYAYTGLDPDNENQRQFQAFLARNGFKVVTKDIRKYGDGKVKANLDIELVVDLMKTARNLDVAVVVSGDGDFAPAIRAVQETGVRVEVISFRGNTSSDLMEVADLFTDITQIAKVERGSVRSGRRVAASDDLSMTEVPDKETEGAAQRKRRARGASREGAREGVREVARAERGARRPATRSTADVGEPVAPVGSLVVLPGEKLRRAAGATDVAVLDEASADAVAAGDAAGEAVETGTVALFDGDEQGAGDGGGRRRRRRGGRGRGRGRGGETPGLPELPGEEGLEDEEEEIADLVAPLPARPTFGSVWDSQLGMPTAASAAAASADELEEDLEEPEIPEYLLAERRRRGGRGRQPRGRGGHAPAYQQALDRERYGRSAMNAPAAPAPPAPRRDRARAPAARVGRPGGADGMNRDRQRPPRDAVGPSRPSAGGDPWSEVPPEIEELLRAEMSKQGAREAVPAGPAGVRPAEAPARAAAGEAVAASRGRGRGGRGRGRGREAASSAGDAGVMASAAPAGAKSAGDEAPSPAAAAAAKPAARTRRPAASPRTSTAGAEPRGVEPAAVAAPDRAPTSPPRAPRKPRASKTGAAGPAAGAAAGTDAGPSAGHAAAADGAPTKRAPRRRKAEPEG